MRWLAGTSGYSYKAWQGSFYPADLPAAGMLAHYASKLPAVEINNTFYRMPRAEVLKTWRETVPAAFRFAIKAPRRITHQAKLADCEDSVEYLAHALEALDGKLGCVLFQLPPYLRKNAALLDAFLGAWPRAFPAAVEFRHASWFDAEIADVLHRRAVAICVSEDGKLALPPFHSATNWVYFRLRKPGYDDAELERWLERGNATGADAGFAFFKHEDAGAGPRLAARFIELADSQSGSRGSNGGADGVVGAA